MTANEHLTDEQAMDLAAGRLSAVDAQSVAAHAEDCRECREAVAFWRRSVEAALQRHTHEPSESAVRRAVAVFDPGLLPASGWKRLLASVVFDSRRETALAGVRDAGASFQILAQVEDLEIDLLCEPEGDSWRITGQVVGDIRTARAFSRLSSPLSAEASLNEAGEFVFHGVTTGEVSLEIESAEYTVALEPFRLGGQGD